MVKTKYIQKSDNYYQKIEYINNKKKITRISKKLYEDKTNKKGGWGLASLLPSSKKYSQRGGGGWGGHQY